MSILNKNKVLSIAIISSIILSSIANSLPFRESRRAETIELGFPDRALRKEKKIDYKNPKKAAQDLFNLAESNPDFVSAALLFRMSHSETFLGRKLHKASDTALIRLPGLIGLPFLAHYEMYSSKAVSIELAKIAQKLKIEDLNGPQKTLLARSLLDLLIYSHSKEYFFLKDHIVANDLKKFAWKTLIKLKSNAADPELVHFFAWAKYPLKYFRTKGIEKLEIGETRISSRQFENEHSQWLSDKNDFLHQSKQLLKEYKKDASLWNGVKSTLKTMALMAAAGSAILVGVVFALQSSDDDDQEKEDKIPTPIKTTSTEAPKSELKQEEEKDLKMIIVEAEPSMTEEEIQEAIEGAEPIFVPGV